MPSILQPPVCVDVGGSLVRRDGRDSGDGIAVEWSFDLIARAEPLSTLAVMDHAAPPPCLDDDLPIDPAPLTSQEMAAIAKAMGHPVHIQIIEFFQECKPLVVGEITAHLTLSQSTVSEHFRILRDANILCTKNDGPRSWHCLNRSVLKRFARDTEAMTIRTDR